LGTSYVKSVEPFKYTNMKADKGNSNPVGDQEEVGEQYWRIRERGRIREMTPLNSMF
jgi:hypothetical protein